MLLSIVIPTKDRYKYLFKLITLLDSYEMNDVELVIEDNTFDNSEYLSFIDKHQFKIPIVYQNEKKPLAMRYNIDNAISHSHGKYVCLLGDDDAVTPLIVDCVKWMEAHNIDSVRQEFEITYKWPAYKDEDNIYLKGGTLSYHPFTHTHRQILIEDAVNEVVQNGFVGLGNTSCVYQGIVSREMLDKLYSIGGCYMPGPSPDMANAMALSHVVKTHYVIDSPVIISGGSEYQGGRSKEIKSWVQPLSVVPYISEEDKKLWDKRIPHFWSDATVWPESGIKGLEYVNQYEKIDKIDFDMIRTRALIRGKEYKSEILKQSDSPLRVLTGYYKYRCRRILSKLKHFIVPGRFYKQNNVVFQYGLNDIMRVKEYFEDKKMLYF